MRCDLSSSLTDVVVDDATLALGVAAGDRDSLAAVYDRYAEPLLSFCQRLVRDPADAERCLRQVFALAAAHLADLRTPAMLRPWLFAVARHECRLRNEERELAPAAAPMPPTEPAAAAEPTTEPLDTATTGELPAVEHIIPVDLFVEPTVQAEVPYRDLLPLVLADQVGLADVEVAAAIGVPRAEAPAIIDTARRSGVVLAADTAAASETNASMLRDGILAAAVAVAVAYTAPPAYTTPLADAGQWANGWPPGDPAFATEPQSRRWGAPLAVLAVLALALCAIFGLLAITGGSDKHTASQPIATVPIATTTAAPTSAPPTASAPAPAGTGVAGVAAPPAASAASAAPTPTTPGASGANGTWTVIVKTDQHAIQISSGRAQAGCAAHTTCSFSVANAAMVTVADTKAGRQVVGADTFSAPPSCAAQRTGSCTFVVTTNLSIVLTTSPLLHLG